MARRISRGLRFIRRILSRRNWDALFTGAGLNS
jgi:hypothetical protein